LQRDPSGGRQRRPRRPFFSAFVRQDVDVVLVVPTLTDAIPWPRFVEHIGADAGAPRFCEVRTVNRAQPSIASVRAARLSRAVRPDLLYPRALPAAATSLAALPTVFEAHPPRRETGRLGSAALRVAEWPIAAGHGRHCARPSGRPLEGHPRLEGPIDEEVSYTRRTRFPWLQ
jgi:hypothetical protein